MSTFNWRPNSGPTQARQPKVRTAAFGDGYQQRVASGINASPRSWSLQFTRREADIDAIEVFLNAHNGVTSFDWQPPTGLPGKWICRSWSRTVTVRKVQGLEATFEEVFGD
ncbi:phage tail protein [Comamonas sp. HJ-2]